MPATQPAPTDESTWLTEQQAAETLGCSVPTIRRYVEAGKIEQRKRPIPGRKPENILNPEDVQALMPAPRVMPRLGHQTAESLAIRPQQPSTPQAAGALLAALEAIAATRPVTVGIKDKLWLTLDEAGTLSGRSKSWLVRQCQEGMLAAEKDGGWRILRRSLEDYHPYRPADQPAKRARKTAKA